MRSLEILAGYIDIGADGQVACGDLELQLGRHVAGDTDDKVRSAVDGDRSEKSWCVALRGGDPCRVAEFPGIPRNIC